MITKRLYYVPHSDGALEIHRHPARFRILDCGRRYGKSTIEMSEAFMMSMEVRKKHNRPSRGWVVAPTYDLAMEEWRIAIDMWREVLDEDGIKRQAKRLYLFDGSEIEFKSADSKDTTLRGAGLDWAIMAEAARLPKEAWEQGIRPALADKQGRAVFGSTPKGRNWFYDIFTLGQDPTNSKIYKSWKLPTLSNPLFPKEEWDTLKKTMPELIFQQEFMAEFLEDSAIVFRGVKRCISGDLQEPEPGHLYYMGVDLARTVDFSVFVIFDANTKHLVHFERSQNLDWSYQKERILWLAKKYNGARIWIDSTGVGDPIERDLRLKDCLVYGYKFSNTSKKELVEWGMMAIQENLITFPEIPELIGELQAFEYEVLPSGLIRYRAPEGLHDDCVMALLLALYGMKPHIYFPEKPKEKKKYEDLPDKDYVRWERWHKGVEESRSPKKVSDFLEMI